MNWLYELESASSPSNDQLVAGRGEGIEECRAVSGPFQLQLFIN